MRLLKDLKPDPVIAFRAKPASAQKSSITPAPAATLLTLPRKQLHRHVLSLWDGSELDSLMLR